MDIPKVTIYTDTSIRDPDRGKGAGVYVLEFKKGDYTGTRDGAVCMEQTTETELTLMLLADAFRRFTKPCSVLVNTECRMIHKATRKGADTESWLEQWKKNGWRKARGLELKYAELWKEFSRHMDRHFVTVGQEDNGYKTLYRKEVINRELEAEHRKDIELKRDVYKAL